MKKMVLLLITTILSSAGFSQQGFILTGSASGFPNHTLLYLEYTDLQGNKVLDSVAIVNEKFSLQGSLPTKAVHVVLHTASYSDYKFFWLENTTQAFEAKKGRFRQASITGSATQDEQQELDSSLSEISEEKKKQQYITFISNHSGSVVSAYVLSVYATTWGKETVAPLYEKLSDEMKASSYGQGIKNYLVLNKNLQLGDRYIDFTLPDTQQKLVKLSDFEGKVVLLEFWGSWCGPCRKENPNLVKIYSEFKDKGFEVLGVAAEKTEGAWLKAIKTDQLPWTNVSDIQGDQSEPMLVYGINYYPTNFLIDKSGTIVARDLKGDKLRKKLEEIL